MNMNIENKEMNAKASDVKVIREIENILSISIPEVNFMRNRKNGYKLQHNHITELSIHSVNCQKILENIFSLDHLEKLILNDTELKFIPESIKNLQNLIELSLKNNSLEFIPDELLDLPNLRTLNLTKNKIQSFITKEGQLSLLKSLEIEKNVLKTVEFAENSAFILESLLLNKNNIEKLDISKLVNLKQLSAQFNHLTEIPDTTNLPKLHTMELDFNEIREFTINENNINKIINLSISYNKISTIDFAITKKIDYFIYDGNPLDKKSIAQLKHISNSKSSNLFYR